VIRSDNTIVEDVVSYLTQRGGAASATDICRDVMGFANCEPGLAMTLLERGLPEDHRLQIAAGGVHLNGRKRPQMDLGPELRHCRFAVVDVEATSLPKPNNRVIEISGVHLDYQTIGDSFDSLVNPTVPIPNYVQKITGLTNEDVVNAPVFEKLAGELRDFIGDRIVVAHNVAFDIGILNSEFKKAGQGAIANPALCTVRLSRALLPGLDRHRLGEVAEYFNITIENQHRAYDDALAAARILARLLVLAEEQEKTHLQHLLKVAGLKRNSSW